MLSNKTKYGLKALIYIAQKTEGAVIQISEIAEAEQISRKFLETILLDLKRNGILGAKKGKGGGYYLLKDAKLISMASVIRILDGPIALLPCVSLNFYEPCKDCKNEAHCRLNHLLREVRDNTLRLLESKSLYDVATVELSLLD